jgi:hypothetical protein
MTEVKSEGIVPDERVLSKIYYIRGYKVMLDKDLAELYGVEPRRLRQQVKRNADRFPEKFMFQLTDTEIDSMVSQIAIPSKQHLGGYLPYAFTEHGVLMLASILRSKIAMQVSVRIIEIFVKMREMLSAHSDILTGRSPVRTRGLWPKCTDIMVWREKIIFEQIFFRNTKLKLEQLERKVSGHDEDIQLIFKYLKKLITPSEQTERRRIGFRRPNEQE